MAAPFPKPKAERRNRTPPHRGEWVDLEPLEAPVLPVWHAEMTCPHYMWEAWRQSPVTAQYGPEDIAAICELAHAWGEMTFADRDRRMTYLALNPKGKRDLRWRTPNEVKTIKHNERKAAAVRPLRVVTEEQA